VIRVASTIARQACSRPPVLGVPSRGTRIRSAPWRCWPTAAAPSPAPLDRTLRLWDLATGETLRTLTRHTSQVTAVAVLADGSRALSFAGVRVYGARFPRRPGRLLDQRPSPAGSPRQALGQSITMSCGRDALATYSVISCDAGRDRRMVVAHRSKGRRLGGDPESSRHAD